MTKQESFKRRVRERMSKTGERYSAARRVLLEQAEARAARPGRTWISQPEVVDDRVLDATGRGWNDWCEIIDSWEGSDGGHTPVAAWLQSAQGLDGWWAQQVTGGWERITGRRLPGEMPDGTFTANKSKTVSGDADMVRKMLLDDDLRADLFPGKSTELRSNPTAKAIRIGFAQGVASLSLTEKKPGRVAITVQHSKLPTSDDIDEWKFYWDEWLSAIDDSSS